MGIMMARLAVDGCWQVASGKWQVASGKWQVASGMWQVAGRVRVAGWERASEQRPNPHTGSANEHVWQTYHRTLRA